MKFLYRLYHTTPSPTVPSGILHRAEVPLRITGATGSITLWALVDGGSDDTLFPLSLAKIIGARTDTTQTWKVEGIGGHGLSIILGEVILELTDGKTTFRWPARIGFVDFPDPHDETALVGHAGFLDLFRVTYDGHLRSLEIEATPAFGGEVV